MTLSSILRGHTQQDSFFKVGCTLILMNHSLMRQKVGFNDGKPKIRIALKVQIEIEKNGWVLNSQSSWKLYNMWVNTWQSAKEILFLPWVPMKWYVICLVNLISENTLTLITAITVQWDYPVSHEHSATSMRVAVPRGGAPSKSILCETMIFYECNKSDKLPVKSVYVRKFFIHTLSAQW